jgi:phage/plasmid-associated DNA primase
MTTFDTNPWLLNVRNGTLDLRTGTLHPHNPADRITRCIPLDYDPEAPRDRFVRFMAEVFPDPRTVEYLQRYFGYTITAAIASKRCSCISAARARMVRTPCTTICATSSGRTRMAGRPGSN